MDMAVTGPPMSPRQGAFRVEETSGGTMPVQQRQSYGGLRTLLDRLRSAEAIELGCRVAGVRRVDLDGRFVQLVRELNRDRVQRGLGRVVGEELHCRELEIRVLIQRH